MHGAARLTSNSVDAIRRHLDEVLESEEFAGSERRRDLLRFVVEHTLDNGGDSLKAYTIGTKALGRASGFDPQTDPIVRVEVGRLRATLDRYYRSHEGGDVVISVPKGRYCAVFDLRTPTAAPVAERSTLISLQPFLASSSDVDPLAAAITESTLKVLNDAGSHASAARPGDRAPFVLAGTARSSGNRIRVVATLTAANSADPLWTRTIDAERHHDHLFDLADAIAARIAWPIADTFGVVGSRSNDGDAGAFDRYRRLFESLSTDASREVCSLLDTRLGTVGPDPRVRAALSDALFTAWWLDLDAPAGALDRAEDLAAAAIAADPTAPEGHLAAAYVHYGRGRTRLFELELDAALAASQDSPHLAVSSGLLRVLVGDIDAGLELLRHGVELNPNLPAWWHVGTCVAAVDRGDLETALVEAVQVGDTAAHIGPFLRLALKSLLGHDDTSSDAKCLLEFDDRYGDRLDERLGRVIRIDTVRNRLIEAVRASGTLPIADAP